MKGLTPVFLSFQGPSLVLIREIQRRLCSIIYSLVSKQERPLEAVFPACCCSLCLFISLSFSFLALASTLSLEQHNSSRASVPVNPKTIIDIRWHHKLNALYDGLKSVPFLDIFHKDRVTAKIAKAKSSIFLLFGLFCFVWGFFSLWHHLKYSRENS